MSERSEGSERNPGSTVGVRDLRAGLATHLARVEAGETLIINRGGRPVARLAPVDEPSRFELGLEEMAQLGLVERPRSRTETGRAPAVRNVSSVGSSLPVDIRVDRIVRQVRG